MRARPPPKPPPDARSCDGAGCRRTAPRRGRRRSRRCSPRAPALPSLVMPDLILTTAAGRKVSKKNSSSRLQHDLDGLAGGLGQPGRLDGLLAGALAAESAADEGRDDPHIVRRRSRGPWRSGPSSGKGSGWRSRPWPCCPRPGPGRYASPWPRGPCSRRGRSARRRFPPASRLLRAARPGRRRSPVPGVLEQMVEDRLIVDAAPAAASNSASTFDRASAAWSGFLCRTATKSPSWTTVTPSIFSAAEVSTLLELGAVGRGPEELGVQHARQPDVAGVLGLAGDFLHGRPGAGTACSSP